jgi:hypothetical protein
VATSSTKPAPVRRHITRCPAYDFMSATPYAYASGIADKSQAQREVAQDDEE